MRVYQWLTVNDFIPLKDLFPSQHLCIDSLLDFYDFDCPIQKTDALTVLPVFNCRGTCSSNYIVLLPEEYEDILQL